MASSVNGGASGVDFTLRVLLSAPSHLRTGGSLIFVLTSTSDFRRVTSSLDEIFGVGWRMSYHSPVAQPFIRCSSVRAAKLRECINAQSVLAWESDGWIWRLTWIVVARHASDRVAPTAENSRFVRPVDTLWYSTYGNDSAIPEFHKMVEHFRRSPSHDLRPRSCRKRLPPRD